MTIAIAIIAGVGLVAALALAIADKYLAVREDPRIGMVTAALPGANCGGCGFPGCDGYARALVAGTAPNGACAAGGDACAAAIAKILGVEATATEKRVALVKCCGTRSEAIRVGDYNGICDCSVAAMTAGGDKGCTYGCLGYGACANVCPKGAISIHDGLAKVDKRLCIGCGKCVTACPKKIIDDPCPLRESRQGTERPQGLRRRLHGLPPLRKELGRQGGRPLHFPGLPREGQLRESAD